jgi:chromate transport protein ChrA
MFFSSSFRKAKRNSHVVGLATGLTFFIINLIFSATFRYGAKLLVDNDITLKEMMT